MPTTVRHIDQPSPGRPAHWRALRRLPHAGAREDGVVLVLVALLMTVFVGLAALAIDVGSFDEAQTKAQSAADAAAVAAAQDLPTGTTAAVTDANSYAQTNDPGPTVTVTTPYNGNPNQVKGASRRAPPPRRT